MNKELSDVSKKEIQALHEAIGLHAKSLREYKGFSQLDTALALGIKSVAFYSNCENSKNDKHFNIEHIYKICKLFDISLDEFFKEVNV